MRRLHGRVGTRAIADERGFTLIELLVVLSMTVMVFGGVVMVLVTSLNSEAGAANRTSNLEQLQTALERINHVARTSTSVTYLTGKGQQAIELQPGNVIFDCSSGAKCIESSQAGAPGVIASNLNASNLTIFTLNCRYQPGSASEGDLVAAGVASPPTCPSGATSTPDNIQIKLFSAAGCTAQTPSVTSSCPNGSIEVDGSVSLRNVDGLS